MGDYDNALSLYRKVLAASRGDRDRTKKVNEKIKALQEKKREQNPLFKRNP
jgi:cytochrome c-type biogenesis protein CcmH/NrfG